MTSGLLDDYVSLGLIAPPQAAAPSPASTRPPQLAEVPWQASLRGFSSPLVKLHQEIVEFCRYLSPAPAEAAARKAAIDRVSEVVGEIWPTARVEVFGSFATGLYLPTSDLDAVILGSGCTNIPAGLKALATSLARRALSRNMTVIAKARVPIVKFEEAESGYNFDVSFDVANGPEAAGNVRALMDSLPPMRPLVMVLKVFLQQRELNEVYSGGLGSYALLVLVAAFLQTHPSRRAAPAGRAPLKSSPAALEGNLGALLLDFLRLYGRALANTLVGVSCRRGGGFFAKRDRGFYNAERPALFAVEDPNDASNDLGKNSYNVARARMAFDYAYCQLVAPAAPGESLLRRIVRLDPVLFMRAAPAPLPSSSGKRARSPDAAAERGGRQDKRKRRAKQSPAAAPERRRSSTEGEQRCRAADPGKGKKRRHRERSASDEDLGGARQRGRDEVSGGRGSAGGEGSGDAKQRTKQRSLKEKKKGGKKGKP